MSDKHLAITALAGALATAAALTAQTAPPPIPVELRARFGFRGPLPTKVGDGIGNLQIVDRDGNGRVEAVVFDARRARLVLVGVDGDEARQHAIPTDGQIGGYVFADLDGDKRPELLLVDARGRLSVRDAAGAPREGAGRGRVDLGLGGRGLSLLAGQLDGRGAVDLVVFGDGRMRIVTGLDGEPSLSAIEPLEQNVHSVHLTHLDGDGALDVVCIAPGERMNLRFRFGRGDGTFGPWRIATVDGLRDVFPARLADGSHALGTIEGQNRRIALRHLVDDGEQAALEWWAFGDGDGTRTPPFAIGDLDGDGDDDLAVFPPDRAQMWFYEWRDDTFVRRALPTLAGVASAAFGDVDGDGRIDLVVASPEEDAVAWRSGAAPLDQFPEQLQTTDKPVAVAVSPEGGVLVVARNERREGHLDAVAPNAPPRQLVELGRLPADPVRLIAADVGDAEGLEVAFVVPNEGLRTLTLGTGDKPGEKATAGFTRKMDDGALALSRRDGKPALVAVRERFVRCFRIDTKGQIDVLAQDNGPEGAAELSLACELGDGDWLYLDKKSDKLLRTAQGRPPVTIEVPALGFTHLVAHRGAALLLGPRGVLRVPFGSGSSLRQVATHEPPTERTHYWHGRSGDFDGDGVTDLAVIDRHLPGVMVLAGGATGLERALAVPVFETPPSEGPGNEPREMAAGDVDGDGLCDLVLVTHDRILVYPQDR